VKGKFLPFVFASLLPMSLAGQVVKPASTDTQVEFDRYEVFAGVDYSSANQVKSSSALIGGNVGVSAKLKKWFGGSADFGDYGVAATSNGLVKPTVTTFLIGPEFYIPSDSITGFLHVLVGGAHTGGVGARPDISFATAFGGGFEYKFSRHWAARVSGDSILSSFVLDPDNQGFSAHLRANARASGGVAYHF